MISFHKTRNHAARVNAERTGRIAADNGDGDGGGGASIITFEAFMEWCLSECGYPCIVSKPVSISY